MAWDLSVRRARLRAALPTVPTLTPDALQGGVIAASLAQPFALPASTIQVMCRVVLSSLLVVVEHICTFIYFIPAALAIPAAATVLLYRQWHVPAPHACQRGPVSHSWSLTPHLRAPPLLPEAGAPAPRCCTAPSLPAAALSGSPPAAPCRASPALIRPWPRCVPYPHQVPRQLGGPFLGPDGRDEQAHPPRGVH